MNTFNPDDDVNDEMRPDHVECYQPAEMSADLYEEEVRSSTGRTEDFNSVSLCFHLSAISSSAPPTVLLNVYKCEVMWFAPGGQGEIQVFVREFGAFLLWCL